MQRCSEKAFAMCPTRHLCGTIEDATFADDSECAAFNRAVEDKPMTNADKIRAMNDEDIAYFLCGLLGFDVSDGIPEWLIMWLNATAEGD